MSRIHRLSAIVLGTAILNACTVLTPTQTQQMQQDISDMKMEIVRIHQTMAEYDRQLFYKVTSIQDHLQIRDENVDATLAEVRKSVENLRQPATPSPNSVPGNPPDALTAATNTPSPADAGASTALFSQAMQAWSDNKVAQARETFQNFLSQFPSDANAAQAQLMIGETYYKENKFSEALPAYQEVLNKYKGSASEPEAAAKVAFCYVGMDQPEKARPALERVLERYPNYDQAELVKDMLTKMK